MVSFFKYRQCLITAPDVRTRIFAFGALASRLRVRYTNHCLRISAPTTVYKALTNQGGGASVYRPRSLPQYKRQLPSKRAYNTIRVFRAPGYDLLRAIKLVRIHRYLNKRTV